MAVVNDTLYAIGGGRSILQADSTDVWQYTPIGYIPEFPTWIILPLLLTVTLVIMVGKQRLTKNTRKLTKVVHIRRLIILHC